MNRFGYHLRQIFAGNGDSQTCLLALGIPSPARLAGTPRLAARRPRPPLPATLAPFRRAVRSAAVASTPVVPAPVVPPAAAAASTPRAKLAVDESEGLLPIHTNVPLVHGLAVPGTAVGVGGVAVRLDLARVRAHEARGTGGELHSLSVPVSKLG